MNRCSRGKRYEEFEGTDNVESAVFFFVEMIVSLEDIAVARCLHGYHLLLHFRVRALVPHFEDLQCSDEAASATSVRAPWRQISVC